MNNTGKILFSLVRNTNKIQSYVLDHLPDLNVNSFMESRYDVISFDGVNGALVLSSQGKQLQLSEVDFAVALYGEAMDGMRFYEVTGMNMPTVRLFEIVTNSPVYNCYGHKIIVVLHENKDGSIFCETDGEFDYLGSGDYKELKKLSCEGGCYRSTTPNKNIN